MDTGQQSSSWQTVKEEKVTDSLYLCPVCNTLFSQPKCLTVHLKKVHQVDCNEVEPYGISMEGSVLRLKRVWKDQDKVRTSYKCLQCDTVMNQHRKFAMHVRVDDQKQITCEKLCPEGRALGGYQRTLFLKGYKNYLCHSCGASFTEKSTFYNHIEAHGEAVSKKYMCEFCPYQSTRQRRMLNHTQSKHSSEPRPRPNVCEICGKGFFNKNMLGRHKVDVHVKEKKFQCDLCPKVFLRRHKLMIHKNLHSGIRPFVCNQCGQTFTVAYNLKVHQRLHTGEKPYKCQQCDAAFAQKNSLDVHMKKHWGPSAPRTSNPIANQRQKVDSQQQPPPPPPSVSVSPPHPGPQMGSPVAQRASSPLPQVGPTSPPAAQGHPLSSISPPPPPRHKAESPSLPPPSTHTMNTSHPLHPYHHHHPPHQRLDPHHRIDPHARVEQHLRLDSHQRMDSGVQQHLDLHQRLDHQQRLDFQTGRMDADSPQRHRVDPYMYPGYSSVVFPGLPGSTYPFYQNM